MTLQWFISKTVRHATAMRKHVRRILSAQRDILAPQAIQAVSESLDDLSKTIRDNAKKDALIKQMEKVEQVANKWLKPYPHAVWRENVEVLLVALAVAMGIRTFFLQPFKIPTGSMQPTLFGVTSDNLIDQPDFQIPGRWERIKQWVQGVSYVHVVAAHEGELEVIKPPLKLLIFNIRQRLLIGGHWQTIWFPPDYGAPESGGSLEVRAGLRRTQHYNAGEDVVKLRVRAGDYLFVNRWTYNFRPPKRGEIIVFETTGTRITQQDTFYIKRLVALGGERVQIGDDRHLVINGNRLDASTPHFENVYSFDPHKPPAESQYSGHLNQKVAEQYRPGGMLAPYFMDGSTTFQMPEKCYMVMGDNTLNSFDSRGWGEFPASKVIGKSSLVYWPLTTRFGFGYRR